MTIALIAILIVFFAFGSQMALNYIAARIAFAITADKRNNSAILVLMLYLNFWIIENLIDLFNDFDMSALIAVAATEVLMYGLCFLVTLIMSLFSRNESKFITYPTAFLCSLLSIPIINNILNFLDRMIGIIIV